MQDECIRSELCGVKFHSADHDDADTAPMVEVAGVSTTIMFERDEDGTTRVVVAVSVEDAAPWLRMEGKVPITVEINGNPVFQG